jgi:hypothetical protein
MFLQDCRPHLLAADPKITWAADGEKISSRADLKAQNVSNSMTKPAFSRFVTPSCKPSLSL